MLKKILLLQLGLLFFVAKMPGVISANGGLVQQKIDELSDVNDCSDDDNESMLNVEFFKIVGASVLGSVLYGIAHDQITARLCIEYFNSDAVPHHKRLLDNLKVMPTTSPTLVACIWGVAATWWVGLIGGIMIGLSSRTGSKLPRLKVKDIHREMKFFFGIVGVVALLAGIVGYHDQKAIDNLNSLPQSNFIPQESRAAFIAVASAHNAAYLAAAIGIILFSIRVMYKRGVLAREQYRELKQKLMACNSLTRDELKNLLDRDCKPLIQIH